MDAIDSDRSRFVLVDDDTAALTPPILMSSEDALQVFGLTGGIGSGKSTVARLLREQGVTVVDADVLAREAVAPGSQGLQQIVDAFGADMLLDDGTLNRAAMGERVFSDDEARQTLNGIVHPEVGRLFMERVQQGIADGLRHMVYEVPLLFENNLDDTFAATVLVAVSPETQLQRVMARDDLTAAQAQARIDSQMPLADKRARADHVVDNDAGEDELRDKVQQLWTTLTA